MIAARVPGDENLEIRVIDTGIGMKKDESTNPGYVSFFGPVRVVFHSKRIPVLVEQFFGLGNGIHFNIRPFWHDIT